MHFLRLGFIVACMLRFSVNMSEESVILGLQPVLVIATKRENKTFSAGRIYEGKDAKIKDHPWMVSLQIEVSPKNRNPRHFSHICGGSIIQKDTVLTAEHCNPQYLQIPIERLLIVAGVSDKRCHNCKNAQTFRAVKWIGHKDFRESNNGSDKYVTSIKNDIALIKLKGFFIFTQFVNVISLPLFAGEISPITNDCKISGWGEFSGDTLKVAGSDILSEEDCRTKTKEAFILDLSEDFSALEDLKKLLSFDQKILFELYFLGRPKEEQIEFFAEMISSGMDLQNKICSWVKPFSVAGVCPGDSGGPLYCKKGGSETPFLFGIVSHFHIKKESLDQSNSICTTIKASAPVINTDVRKYIDWIKSYENVIYWRGENETGFTGENKEFENEDYKKKSFTGGNKEFENEDYKKPISKSSSCDTKLGFLLGCLLTICYLSLSIAFTTLF